MLEAQLLVQKKQTVNILKTAKKKIYLIADIKRKKLKRWKSFIVQSSEKG